MNPMDLFKNLKDMQGKLGDMQEKIKAIKVSGSAGGEMVKVEMTGDFMVTDVIIAPEVVDPNDIVMLQDLIKAAFINAMNNAKDKIKEESTGLAGGMGLPTDMFGL